MTTFSYSEPLNITVWPEHKIKDFERRISFRRGLTGLVDSEQACADEVLAGAGTGKLDRRRWAQGAWCQATQRPSQQAARLCPVAPVGGRRPAPTQAGCLTPGGGAGEAHHILPWARQSRRHSHPLRHTSSVLGCSGLSPCSGTHPPRRSSGLQGGGAQW